MSALSTNEVTVLYDDVLFRAPDSGGLNYWVSELDAGSVTVPQMISTFVNSSEVQTVVDPIIRLYVGLFGGSAVSPVGDPVTVNGPGELELGGWVNLENSGTSFQQIVEDFIKSSNFNLEYSFTTPTQFVEDMYVAILGRPADPGGLASWLGVLGIAPTTADEADVIIGIVNSTEFINDTRSAITAWLTAAADTAEAGTTATALGSPTYAASVTLSANEVTVAYDDVLFRAPDPGGLAGWASLLDAGTLTVSQMVSDIANSSEAQTLVDPIVGLYGGLFGRVPDPAGLASWINLERSGTSFEQIVQDFVGSAEFANDYGTINSSNITKFMELLYENILGRPADPGGLASWLAVLGTTPTTATEAEVVTGLLTSSEFIKDSQYGIAAWLSAGTIEITEHYTTAQALGTPYYPSTFGSPYDNSNYGAGPSYIGLGSTNLVQIAGGLGATFVGIYDDADVGTNNTFIAGDVLTAEGRGTLTLEPNVYNDYGPMTLADSCWAGLSGIANLVLNTSVMTLTAGPNFQAAFGLIDPTITANSLEGADFGDTLNINLSNFTGSATVNVTTTVGFSYTGNGDVYVTPGQDIIIGSGSTTVNASADLTDPDLLPLPGQYAAGGGIGITAGIGNDVINIASGWDSLSITVGTSTASGTYAINLSAPLQTLSGPLGTADISVGATNASLTQIASITGWGLGSGLTFLGDPAATGAVINENSAISVYLSANNLTPTLANEVAATLALTGGNLGQHSIGYFFLGGNTYVVENVLATGHPLGTGDTLVAYLGTTSVPAGLVAESGTLLIPF